MTPSPPPLSPEYRGEGSFLDRCLLSGRFQQLILLLERLLGVEQLAEARFGDRATQVGPGTLQARNEAGCLLGDRGALGLVLAQTVAIIRLDQAVIALEIPLAPRR